MRESNYAKLMNKTLRNAIMTRKRLRNKFFNEKAEYRIVR